MTTPTPLTMAITVRQPIPAPPPGIYHDVPPDVYHSWAAVNASLLKACDRSPAHGRCWLSTAEEPPSDALRFGSAYHCFLFEPDLFKTRYGVVAKFDRRSAAAKAEWESLVKQWGGERHIVWESEVATMEAMRSTMFEHARAKALATGIGYIEVSVVWTDPVTLLPCKCRIDALRKIGEDWPLVDVKSTTDARWRQFGYDAAKFMYHVSAAWYVDGVEVATGRKLPFILIPQEKDAPYAVDVLAVDDAQLAAGRATYRRLLNTFSQCLARNMWPAYGNEVNSLWLPKWVYQDQENAVA